MGEWTTRVPPENLVDYGLFTEVHAVFFQPDDDRDGGLRDAVTLLVPEVSSDDCRKLLWTARELRARVAILCDTEERAATMARRAARILRHHRRISLERAAAGRWGLAKLS